MKGVQQIYEGLLLAGAVAIDNKILPSDVAYTITASTTNACEIDVELVYKDDKAVEGRQVLDLYVSGDSTGAGVYSAAGTMSITNGFSLGTYTANLAYPCMTDETGKVSFKLTYATKPEIYICAVPQSTGHVAVSRKLVTADYGA